MSEHPLLKALRSGDKSGTFEEIRDELGRTLVSPMTPAAAKPALARELRVTLEEIDRSGAHADDDPIKKQQDEVARKRADRAAGATRT